MTITEIFRYVDPENKITGPSIFVSYDEENDSISVEISTVRGHNQIWIPAKEWKFLKVN